MRKLKPIWKARNRSLTLDDRRYLSKRITRAQYLKNLAKRPWGEYGPTARQARKQGRASADAA